MVDKLDHKKIRQRKLKKKLKELSEISNKRKNKSYVLESMHLKVHYYFHKPYSLIHTLFVCVYSLYYIDCEAAFFLSAGQGLYDTLCALCTVCGSLGSTKLEIPLISWIT